jgi:predicted GNAT family acetyltransferase
MRDRVAAEAIAANAARWLKILARLPGGESHQDWVITDVPHGLCNAVLFPSDETTPDRRIDEILAAARQRRVSQLWTLDVDRCPTIIGKLHDRGLVEVETFSGMAVAVGELPAAACSAGVRITSIHDESHVMDFAAVFGECFGCPGEVAYAITRVSAESARASPETAEHYVGYVDGQPACTATVLYSGRVAGVYNVATTHRLRGRGLGRAVTLHALNTAREKGCKRAVLYSSALAVPL